MSTYTIFNIYIYEKKENHTKLFYICSYRIVFQGTQNGFETAVENEPSIFEQLMVYCILQRGVGGCES